MRESSYRPSILIYSLQNCRIRDRYEYLYCMASARNKVFLFHYVFGNPTRPAFVNTLFPVTRPHHIYPTALVIIILIDNLKYIIIFVYVWFLPWTIPEVSENASRYPSKQTLIR